jgi:TDG/mug DNA glycosylase family protein
VKGATLGLQEQTIGATKMWILPNPSGLNAHFTAKTLGVLFKAFNDSVE